MNRLTDRAHLLPTLAPALDEYSRRYNMLADRAWRGDRRGTDIVSARGEARGEGGLAGNKKKTKGKKYAYAD